MKHGNAYAWLAVILVIAVMIPAIGCGKKEAQKPTPTPILTPTPTATIPSEPTGETGTLSSLTGNVTVMRQGTSAWITATSGMKIGTGYSLKTGSDGYVLITFFDGSVMEVQADTEISVEELSAASGGATTVHINQVIGNTLNRVKNLVDSSSTYEVETPAGSAVVRGTIEVINVDGTGRTCTDVQDENDAAKHSAAFTGNKVTVNIGEGQTACCEVGGIPGTPFYTNPADDPLRGATGDSSGGGNFYPTSTEPPLCRTCPSYDSELNAPRMFCGYSPEMYIQNISDSFDAGGCRWYLVHLTGGTYNPGQAFSMGYIYGGDYSGGNPIMEVYSYPDCVLQNSPFHNEEGTGPELIFTPPQEGDYLIKVYEDGNDSALSYTLVYFERCN